MSREIWRDVKGHKGYFKVSSKGRFKSVNRIYIDTNGISKKVNGKILKTRASKDKYIYATFTRGGNGYTELMHRMVALAFKENKKQYKEINHINGIKSDNRSVNLEFCTPKQNMAHAKKMGLVAYTGDDCPAAKLKTIQVKLIKEIIAWNRINSKNRNDGFTDYWLAKCFNVTHSSIYAIRRGITWKQVK